MPNMKYPDMDLDCYLFIDIGIWSITFFPINTLRDETEY